MNHKVVFESGSRMLLLNPNLSMSFALPHSIAVLSSCLNERGCDVDLFDTTLYKPRGKSDDDLDNAIHVINNFYRIYRPRLEEIAVNDAYPEVKEVSEYITEKNGGKGAVREVIDKIISQK